MKNTKDFKAIKTRDFRRRDEKGFKPINTKDFKKRC